MNKWNLHNYKEDFTTNFNGTDDIEADEPESDESEEIVVVKPTTTTTTTTQKPSTTERFTDFLKRRKMERYLATTTEDPNMVILGRFTTSTAPSTNVPSGETVPTRRFAVSSKVFFFLLDWKRIFFKFINLHFRVWIEWMEKKT